MGIVSVVFGVISLSCQYYRWFIENDPVNSLDALGGHALGMFLMSCLIIIASFIGVVFGSIALYRRAILGGAVGLIMNLILLIKAISDLHF